MVFLFEIATEANKAIQLLEQKGYEAYLVGGCVRDYILKRPTNDYDITTNATPDEIKAVFCDFKVIETGIKHGTVTVLINNIPLEITTYRLDGDYKDNRHPEFVEFSKKLSDDLCRRDFTVNSLAYNGDIVDYFGGIDDINAKIIRCVGDPDRRFNEDGLRILRALRFASVLGFEIEDNTGLSIISNKHLIKNISAERIADELKKLLLGTNAFEIIKKYGVVFSEIFDGTDFTDRADSISKCPIDIAVRMSSFFLFDEDYKNHLSYLRLDNRLYGRCISAIGNYSYIIKPDKTDVKKFLRLYGVQALDDVLLLKQAEGTDVSFVREIFCSVIGNNECFAVSELNIKGDDLISLGLKNKEIGEKLNLLLDLVIEGKLDNDRDVLYKYIRENIQ